MKAFQYVIDMLSLKHVVRNSKCIAAWCVTFAILAVSTQSHATDVAASALEESVRTLQRSNDELRDEVVRLKDALTSLKQKHSKDSESLVKVDEQLRTQLNDLNNGLMTQKKTQEKFISDLSHLSQRMWVTEQQPKLKWKIHNNGTTSCQVYCNQGHQEGFSGECILAIIGANSLANCGMPHGGPTHCLCVAR